ncbi:ATP-grasp domain-containing protein [Thermodesulfobacteriota bacterium]
MNKHEIVIAVTGLNATENPGPGVGVIRAIREAAGPRASIVGLSYDPLDPGVYMTGICDHVYLIPYPSQGTAALLARLEEIHAKTPIDVIVPTLDSELQAYLRLAPELERMGIRSFLPSEESLKICNKAKFSQLRETHGINVPKGRAITDPKALYRLEDEFTFPIMVKGQFYEAEIAHSPGEAEPIFRRLSTQWGLPVVVQEYIFGEEYDIAAVGNDQGRLVGAIPMRKLRLTDKGKAWGGITIEDPDMNAFARDVIRKLKWRGPCELEIIKTRGDSKYYLIEINPRFPAWCYLCFGAGQNLPWACVRLALGEDVEEFETYNVGAMFLRHSLDMVYPLSMLEKLTTEGELHRDHPVAAAIRSNR